jgi:amidase
MTAPQDKPWKLLRKIAQHNFFSAPFNITGQPAISLPLHWTPEGLPVGVQLVAAMGREDLLIRVARNSAGATVDWSPSTGARLNF